MHSTPPRCGGQCTTNTYKADIPDVGVPDKKASDNLSVDDTRPTYVLKRGYPLGFPTKPYDVTQTIWPLFT